MLEKLFRFLFDSAGTRKASRRKKNKKEKEGAVLTQEKLGYEQRTGEKLGDEKKQTKYNKISRVII